MSNWASVILVILSLSPSFSYANPSLFTAALGLEFVLETESEDKQESAQVEKTELKTEDANVNRPEDTLLVPTEPSVGPPLPSSSQASELSVLPLVSPMNESVNADESVKGEGAESDSPADSERLMKGIEQALEGLEVQASESNNAKVRELVEGIKNILQQLKTQESLSVQAEASDEGEDEDEEPGSLLGNEFAELLSGLSKFSAKSFLILR